MGVGLANCRSGFLTNGVFMAFGVGCPSRNLSLMLAAVRTCVRRRSSLTHAYLSHYSKPRSFRQFSTSHLDPSIRDFARTIVQTQPCVAMSADDVHILSEPREFHQLLLVGVSVIWFF